jgi:hypothetical protein
MFGINAEQMPHLRDDRLGRALDRLFDADRAALITEVDWQWDVDSVFNSTNSITTRPR